ncbi:prepilin-type N-terminal cleavage/methylation domain-containing protein [Saccharibacillus sp. JS10]|uniref:prepilin-type N-terminal cleavage/methylation domain-containing protein n=1 Tax=Saccharibacillus sp. JS10 TaxID=2950552 RepID=UPI00210BBBD5|nr:prepilin-type N-terminal cleavage/methylation domain-containing protein [Saccharibacillus sp. JS10]MCQ4088771.1 prepilin-type N-terminal cleavage/methylation domain-containing protein [Saccharibacillus sp. JS10]
MNQVQVAEMVGEVEVKEAGKQSFMKRVWAKMGKDEKGFTLIELLAVLVIIAIIAVIAIPLISNIINNSRVSADVSSARQVYDAARLYVTGEKNGDFKGAGTITVKTLIDAKYLETSVSLPSTKQALDSAASNVKFAATSGDLEGVVLSDGKVTRDYTADEVLKATPTKAGNK